ncbi:hypothetical protein C5Y96_07675 [Blastopirellula marina]|uniref:Uncharacterized protein n=1 Tax=Blastopirellula marina TaxID=124 RepID=A0A2S8FXW9_9BACT|nr:MULTISPECIES: hypothetical protein [Pirellulaceae]PQO37029.1 hypothetical protein C5Y96_07675 [Blastopirellula marina]RCS53744.1 hypothetical protein DTL36_07685 [Bremerella cremea]
MINAYGWVIVRSSREKYSDKLSSEEIELLDKEVNKNDEVVWDKFEEYCKSAHKEDILLVLDFIRNCSVEHPTTLNAIG